MAKFVIGGKYWENDRLISITSVNPYGQKDRDVELLVGTPDCHLFNVRAVKDSLVRLDFTGTQAVPSDISFRLPNGKYASLKELMEDKEKVDEANRKAYEAYEESLKAKA